MDQQSAAKVTSVAGNKPEFDDETRHQLALKMIQNARLPKVIPEGFKPLRASDADLRRYGIPPRPNKEIHPLYYAKWEDVLSRPLGIIVPKLTTKRRSARPSYRPSLNRKIVHPNPSGFPWSGAALPHPAGQFVDSVSASWTVPNVFPPHSAWNSSTQNWNDGEWYSSFWVGIDGTFDAGNDVVQAGTDVWLTVQNGVISRNIAAWLEWYPAGTVWLSGFPIESGDTISCLVCLPSDSVTHATMFMTNLTSNLSTFAGFNSPSTAANTQGHVAEWIVEDISGLPYPNYGTTFFYDCAAATKQQNLNLNGSTIWDLIPPGSTTAYSTTSVISPTVLQVQPPVDPNAGFRYVPQPQ